MESFSQMHIFFLISSLGFVVLFILVAVVLIYLIRAMHIFKRMLEKAEKDIDNVRDVAGEMFEDIRDSMVFRFLFKNRKRRRKD